MSDDERKEAAWDAAWQQCYDYFNPNNSEFNEQIASLRLGFFLANFGMFRGSSKLQHFRLEDFARIVKVARKYQSLRGLPTDQLDEKKGEITDFLEEIGAELESKGAKTSGTPSVTPTDTLVTKIALGTTACVPAYDTNVTIALRSCNICQSPSAGGLEKLAKELKAKGTLSDFKKSGDLPEMRQLDKHLMAKGYEAQKDKTKP